MHTHSHTHTHTHTHTHSLSALMIPSVILVVLLLATFALMARLLEHGDIAPAVACVPLYLVFFIWFYLPDPDPASAPG
jgi:membrane-bound ClpP family serine protease